MRSLRELRELQNIIHSNCHDMSGKSAGDTCMEMKRKMKRTIPWFGLIRVTYREREIERERNVEKTLQE